MQEGMKEAASALTDEQRLRLAALVNGKGVRVACERLQLTREALARLCAGLPVRRATLIVAAAAIDALPPSADEERPAWATSDERPAWLDAWAEKNLTEQQRAAFEQELAKNAPQWARR